MKCLFVLLVIVHVCLLARSANSFLDDLCNRLTDEEQTNHGDLALPEVFIRNDSGLFSFASSSGEPATIFLPEPLDNRKPDHEFVLRTCLEKRLGVDASGKLILDDEGNTAFNFTSPCGKEYSRKKLLCAIRNKDQHFIVSMNDATKGYRVSQCVNVWQEEFCRSAFLENYLLERELLRDYLKSACMTLFHKDKRCPATFGQIQTIGRGIIEHSKGRGDTNATFICTYTNPLKNCTWWEVQKSKDCIPVPHCNGETSVACQNQLEKGVQLRYKPSLSLKTFACKKSCDSEKLRCRLSIRA
ncbi:uncharacterized protein [Oscarella lobularis]|uniref:uncharacterized protein n=1 Tax=Oscarella lobularis TaxID=121494 RepID=UPI00331422E5